MWLKKLSNYMINRGVPIQDLKEMLGHSKLDTTNIYVCANIERIKSNIKIIVLKKLNIENFKNKLRYIVLHYVILMPSFRTKRKEKFNGKNSFL